MVHASGIGIKNTQMSLFKDTKEIIRKHGQWQPQTTISYLLNPVTDEYSGQLNFQSFAESTASMALPISPGSASLRLKTCLDDRACQAYLNSSSDGAIFSHFVSVMETILKHLSSRIFYVFFKSTGFVIATPSFLTFRLPQFCLIITFFPLASL